MKGVWAISEEYVGAVSDIMEFRANGITLSREDVAARFGGQRSIPTHPTGNAIAVIPIAGVISEEYGVSPSAIGAQVDAAMANDSVGTIVLAINSPGGEVTGVPELAAKIAEARGRKRVVAVAEGDMASAAYWIGSQAQSVSATPSARVGSIGVFTAHADVSGALANAGINVTLISAGKYKTEASPFAPLGDEAKAAIQARIDEVYGDFVGAVAAGRGVTTAAVVSGFGQGRVESARGALASGMIDKIGGLGEVLGGLVGQSPPTPLRAESATHAALPGGVFVSGGVPNATTTLSSVPATLTLVSPVSDTPPSPSGSVPKEKPVSETPTVVPGATPNVPDARFAAFADLATAHGKTLADVSKWMTSGKSVDEVRADILAGYASGARPTPTITDVHDRAGDKPFASLGEQLQAIANAGRGRGIDPRLSRINAAASGGQSHVGADGGFLIQHQFIADLTKDAFSEGQLLSRCDNTDLGENANGLTVVYNKETSRATGSRWGGVRVYNVDEADTVTASKPGVDKWQLELGKKMGIAYMTEELLQDAPAMQDVYSKAFAEEFAFVCDNEVFRGGGGAAFTGVLPNDAVPASGHPAISVAKETGQLAATIVTENIVNMYARVHPRSKQRGAWFVNGETFPQLLTLQIGTGASGALVYMPPGGISGQPYGTIFGRPVIETEYNAALGTIGDICFLDLSKYKTITKGGVRPSESMHVRFIYDEMTFKWTYRINGAPKDKAPLTPFKATSGKTLSPFVFLATRS